MKSRTLAHRQLALAVAIFAVVALYAAPAFAAPRISTRITIAPSPKNATIYRPLTLSARITNSRGRAIGKRRLILESRAGASGPWTYVAAYTTDKVGGMWFQVQPHFTTHYRLRFAGSSAYKPSSAGRLIYGHGYTLMFSDEFDGSQVDTSAWTEEMRWGDRAPDLLQIFTPGNVQETSGSLIITAGRNTDPSTSAQYPYLSGALSAHGAGQYSFKYGYVETRLKMPRGTGLWPAVWMLPTTTMHGYELDVFEGRGQLWRTNLMTLHWGNNQVGLSYSGSDLSAGYHTFAVDWSPTRVIWYRDSTERFRVEGAEKIPQDPMYLIANMQIGGWGGPPDTSTVLPARFYVDYVRVFQHD